METRIAALASQALVVLLKVNLAHTAHFGARAVVRRARLRSSRLNGLETHLVRSFDHLPRSRCHELLFVKSVQWAEKFIAHQAETHH